MRLEQLSSAGQDGANNCARCLCLAGCVLAGRILSFGCPLRCQPCSQVPPGASEQPFLPLLRETCFGFCCGALICSGCVWLGLLLYVLLRVLAAWLGWFGAGVGWVCFQWARGRAIPSQCPVTQRPVLHVLGCPQSCAFRTAVAGRGNSSLARSACPRGASLQHLCSHGTLPWQVTAMVMEPPTLVEPCRRKTALGGAGGASVALSSGLTLKEVVCISHLGLPGCGFCPEQGR